MPLVPPSIVTLLEICNVCPAARVMAEPLTKLVTTVEAASALVREG